MNKVKVAVIFGGPSTEHEVSLRSADSIIRHLDREEYAIFPIGIDKEGKWFLLPDHGYIQHDRDPKRIALGDEGQQVLLSQRNGIKGFYDFTDLHLLAEVDVVFPIVHGAFGEDGTLQGVLKSCHLPYVGPDVLASSLSMDKDATKRILSQSGIPVAKGIIGYKAKKKDLKYTKVIEELGLPLFVKPANAGSSVGVNKVANEEEFYKAIEEAFLYDRKILIEEAIIGKEIECAILGNEEPQASVLGEIVPTRGFYSYEAKYISDTGALMKIPAEIAEDISDHMRAVAIKAFQSLCCEGIARVDFFLRKDGTFVLNEVNTLPGFTSISMYPKLWEATGLSYSHLLTKMINLAVDRWEKTAALKTSPVDQP